MEGGKVTKNQVLGFIILILLVVMMLSSVSMLVAPEMKTLVPNGVIIVSGVFASALMIGILGKSKVD